MRIVLIADVYPPLRSSGAVQLRDLAKEFICQGHEVTVLVASPDLEVNCKIDIEGGVLVVRLKSPKTKDVGYIRRAIGEFLMPFFMLLNLRRTGIVTKNWEGVVWYSPTIFLGPIVTVLKRLNGCRSYLIIRDIFPEWVADMGLMGRGLPYRFFKTIANYQYSVADVIGVQTPGNLGYFSAWLAKSGGQLEVLHNWLARAPNAGCGISIANTKLAGRIIFVYAGNMGVAQGMGVLLDLAECLKDRIDIGFLFVGRGSDAQSLRARAEIRSLDNVVFFDEIDPDEIPGLYAQCHIGLVALDPRHKTHNIPGKFLSYMLSGLPVLASVNQGNDLIELIEQERVGRTSTDSSGVSLATLAQGLVDEISIDTEIGARCRNLAEKLFSPQMAVQQIVTAIAA